MKASRPLASTQKPRRVNILFPAEIEARHGHLIALARDVSLDHGCFLADVRPVFRGVLEQDVDPILHGLSGTKGKSHSG